MTDGTNRRFRYTLQTAAPRSAIWLLWTTPPTWSSWDKGLESAEIDGAFTVGARGSIVDLQGRRSRFVVTRCSPLESCEYVVSLPLARLTILRRFEPGRSGAAAEHATITHEVAFEGPLGPLFAQLLAPAFRRLLPPTMEALASTAEPTPIQLRPRRRV